MKEPIPFALAQLDRLMNFFPRNDSKATFLFTSNVAKTGIRGGNDLVWVGPAANYAAKLLTLSEFPTYITDDVFNKINEEVKYVSGINMWNARICDKRGGMRVHGSSYKWIKY